ncbi:reverse transcriptase N-terminal domain-containing protein [Trichormus sp. NMC-1]|uniref:reverse transcriptase N-terminal domain-containing protein n=1 Tax=Trichormus sp. NMC-1 TaxID=1853259 RepID=UPI0009F41036|nr:reverse transcriptase N-terminal domain-containing protein [Trichormus sp. NMC-1]
MIRHSYKTSESWVALPWKKFRRNLFRLQKRVYKAVQVGDKRKARLLQKLIMKSTSARFLAIRQVSQLNAGKKTAGVDGKKSLSFKERFELEALLRVNSGNWKHQGLREIPIPKKDGTTRILKIPTIADIAWQCLAKYALEPAHEATFHARSYGFRTGRSAHDAQRYIYNNLNSSCNGIEKRVIELDIEKCFDRINHSAIMDELIAPKGLKLGIFRCLKAGVNPPINVFVAGEVTRPGAYTLNLQGGSGNTPGVQYPTILAALTTAQGVTLAADVTKVQLRRKVGRSGEQIVSFNLKELTQTGTIPQDITLRDGDTLVVPTATSFNIAEARNLFSANFAASQTAPRTVAITGQVYRPGSYLVTAGGTDGAGTGLPTVMRALQLAGGITSQADVRTIKLRRPTRTGTEQTIDINLWELLQTGDLNQDAVVQDGDTIVVPTATAISTAEATELATTTLSPTKIQVGVVGEVKKPGLTDLQPNSSLNQALLAAGGFNDARASSAAVDLIRLNPNGTVTKRVVKIDFSKGINDDTNPILRNNDVVVVGRSGIAKTGDTLGTSIGA